jgi:hypothetical protein
LLQLLHLTAPCLQAFAFQAFRLNIVFYAHKNKNSLKIKKNLQTLALNALLLQSLVLLALDQVGLLGASAFLFNAGPLFAAALFVRLAVKACAFTENNFMDYY